LALTRTMNRMSFLLKVDEVRKPQKTRAPVHTSDERRADRHACANPFVTI
jgi:hypothetical protein